jgi:hypothetical protein
VFFDRIVEKITHDAPGGHRIAQKADRFEFLPERESLLGGRALVLHTDIGDNPVEPHGLAFGHVETGGQP